MPVPSSIKEAIDNCDDLKNDSREAVHRTNRVKLVVISESATDGSDYLTESGFKHQLSRLAQSWEIDVKSVSDGCSAEIVVSSCHEDSVRNAMRETLIEIDQREVF